MEHIWKLATAGVTGKGGWWLLCQWECWTNSKTFVPMRSGQHVGQNPVLKVTMKKQIHRDKNDNQTSNTGCWRERKEDELAASKHVSNLYRLKLLITTFSKKEMVGWHATYMSTYTTKRIDKLAYRVCTSIVKLERKALCGMPPMSTCTKGKTRLSGMPPFSTCTQARLQCKPDPLHVSNKSKIKELAASRKFFVWLNPTDTRRSSESSGRYNEVSTGQKPVSQLPASSASTCFPLCCLEPVIQSF